MEIIDYDQIKTLYSKALGKAELCNAKLPANKKSIDVYIIDWGKYFNDVEKNLWMDIRSVGIFMLPKYPVDKYFIAFGNPFLKIGIHIEYSKPEYNDQEKLNKMKELGWNIYSIKSKDTYETAEDLYSKISDSDINFRELKNKEFEHFINNHFLNNSECLIHHLKKEYFSYAPTDDMETEDMDNEYNF